MKEEYHIWELGDKISVKLHDDFVRKIRVSIRAEYKSMPRFYGLFSEEYSSPYSVFKDRLKSSHQHHVDLEFFTKTCDILNIDLKELETNIYSYKTTKGLNMIQKPILPVKITPTFSLLLAHHFGDGCIVRSGNNRKEYFCYTQFNDEYRALYIKKIESIFGKVIYKVEYFTTPRHKRVYAPTVSSHIMKKAFNLSAHDFLSGEARVPIELYVNGRNHMLAFIIGMIIDEGHVDSDNVIIKLKNHGLILDLYGICDLLGYSATVVLKEDQYGCLYITSRGLDKLYKDYVILIKKYPEMYLGYKGTKIKEFVQRKNKIKRYVPGNRDIILKMLEKEPLNVNELAVRLNMTRQGARYLINKLLEKEMIEVKSVSKFANFEYGVK